MLIENVMGNVRDFPLENRKVDKVLLEWYELDKKLLHKYSQDGIEVGIRLNTDSHGHLHEGDILYADENIAMVVDILPCELTTVEVHSMQEMGRLCFELGNRHLSLSIGETSVSVPYDEPTFLYLTKLGFETRKETAKFSHFTVCHAHSHSHGEHSHSHEE